MRLPRWLPRLHRSRPQCPECGASVLERTQKPIMFLTGDGDMRRAGCYSTYDIEPGPAFLGNHKDTEHLMGPMTKPYLRAAAIAWFRCFLAEDEHACSLFQGDCPICKQDVWAETKRKNIP